MGRTKGIHIFGFGLHSPSRQIGLEIYWAFNIIFLKVCKYVVGYPKWARNFYIDKREKTVVAATGPLGALYK